MLVPPKTQDNDSETIMTVTGVQELVHSYVWWPCKPRDIFLSLRKILIVRQTVIDVY